MPSVSTCLLEEYTYVRYVGICHRRVEIKFNDERDAWLKIWNSTGYQSFMGGGGGGVGLRFRYLLLLMRDRWRKVIGIYTHPIFCYVYKFMLMSPRRRLRMCLVQKSTSELDFFISIRGIDLGYEDYEMFLHGWFQ